MGRFARYNADLDSDEWRRFASHVRSVQGNYCQLCRLGNKPNHVHHIFYDHTRKLWEYEMDEVLVLCESCHKQLHEQLNVFRKHVFHKLNPASFRVLNGALTVALDQYDPLTFVHALSEFVTSPGLIERYAKAWGEEAIAKGGA